MKYSRKNYQIELEEGEAAILENKYVAFEDEFDFSDNCDEPESISDTDTNVLGEYMIEWDSFFGRHWTTYETKEAFEKALLDNAEEWKRYSIENENAQEKVMAFFAN